MPRKENLGRPKGQRRKYATVRGCPMLGCTYFDGKPDPTVPGVKRHVKQVHGPLAYEVVEWDRYSLYPPKPGQGLLESWLSDGSDSVD